MEAFFKCDGGSVMHAPNFVMNKDYELRIEDKDSYTYPVDGWYYFASEAEAYKFFGVPYEEETGEDTPGETPENEPQNT